jgi:DNA-directed RNA polymerase specialized sigma subunit
MSRKHKRRRKHRPGNIKNDPAYNPFPQSGLVKQYEPYIRSVVGEFAKRYPGVRREDFLHRAIELANAAEKTFEPELGFKFSTHLAGFARIGRF